MNDQDRDDTRAGWDRIAPGYDRDQHADPDVAGKRGAAPAGAWRGHAVSRRGGRQRRARHSRRPARRPGARDRPVCRDARSCCAGGRGPEGLAIETRGMDGHALALDDASFDMAGSQFGVMLFPDMPQGHRGDGARRPARRPGGDDRVRRSARDRFHRLLRRRRPNGPPGFRRAAERSAAAPLPVAGSRAAGPGDAGGRARGRDRWRQSPRPRSSAAATSSGSG